MTDRLREIGKRLASGIIPRGAANDIAKAADAIEQLRASDAQLREIAQDNYDSYQMAKSRFELERSRLDFISDPNHPVAHHSLRNGWMIYGTTNAQSYPTLREAIDGAMEAELRTPETPAVSASPSGGD